MGDKAIIMTSDYDTYKQMLAEGLTYLGNSGKFYQFVNDKSKQVFSSKIDQKKLLYTNKLSI